MRGDFISIYGIYIAPLQGNYSVMSHMESAHHSMIKLDVIKKRQTCLK